MKKFLFLFCMSVVFQTGLQAQSVIIRPNKCVELINTVWVLANGSTDTTSQNLVDKHFDKFREHKAVKMMSLGNYNAAIFRFRNDENVLLPYIGLKMKINEDNVISYDQSTIELGRDGICCMPGDPDELMKALSDFYVASDFNRFFEDSWHANSLFYQNNTINLQKINELLGTNVQSVEFVFPTVRLCENYSIPYVIIDGEIVPMFYDYLSELEYPSFFAPFKPQNRDTYPELGLISALTAKEIKSSRTHNNPSIDAILELMNEKAKDIEWGKQGFKVWNFDSKWLPLLLMDEYSTGEQEKAVYIQMAHDIGFKWHKTTLDFMRQYYSDREQYKRLSDFIPQFDAHIVSLSEK